MTDDATKIVIVTDIRGFTKWSEANEVFINLGSFIADFMQLLGKRFPAPEYSLTPTGDGAMLLGDLSSEAGEKDLPKILTRVLQRIAQADADFGKHCAAFARRVGHRTDLRLGWGVVRGKVIRMGESAWTGHNISKCTRLCDEARPFGVVVDRDDFPQLPEKGGAVRLVGQVRRLRGIGDVGVWVSPEIASQFVPRERLRETPEVHVAGTCFVEERGGDIRVLFARRSAERHLFPGKLEGCGGQLRYSETFVEGVRRHFHKEFALDVEVLPAFHKFYEIREPNEPVIPGIRFLCKQVGTSRPHSDNHSEVRWVSEAEFANMAAEDFVGELKHEVMELLAAYKESKQAIRGA